MNWRSFIFFFFAMVYLNASAIAHERLSLKLASVLEDFRDRYGFPGGTASIVLPDGSLVSAATGLADVEANVPMTQHTPMLAASIGKSFVAATVLALESEGRLSRDDLLSVYLGDRTWFGSLPNSQSITIRHLLHHTSGLPDHVYLPEFKQSWVRLARGSTFNPEKLIGFVTSRAPLFKAGQAWAYSDTGYVLLGLAVEEITGQKWQEAVRVRLLDPLALQETFASDRPDLPGLAVGYVAPDNSFGLPERTSDAKGMLFWNPVVEFTGGGFASTSPDLARWGHLLFGGQAMQKPYLERLLDSVPVDAESPDILYGAGVAIYANSLHGRVYGHGGWIPGYVSSLRHYANYGVTVAFQINTDVGIEDDTNDLVPVLEAALAELAITIIQ